MKNAMMLMGVLLLSVSCVELNGSLQVREAMNVKKKSGFLNSKTKIVKLDAGSYLAELKMKSDKNLNLELKTKEGKIDIPIKSAEDLDIPSNGKFSIEGKEIGQPFDIQGEIETNVSESGRSREIVSCEISRVERHCEKVCETLPRESRERPKCEIVCKDVTVTYRGLKEVLSHMRYTEREVSLEFSAENSTALAATLGARGLESDKIIDHETMCR